MSMDEHIRALRAKHAAIDTEIKQENLRPHPDDTHLAELKREKLRIKDEIEKFVQVH